MGLEEMGETSFLALRTERNNGSNAYQHFPCSFRGSWHFCHCRDDSVAVLLEYWRRVFDHCLVV
eukprot:236513-Amphidinium_carterae.2